ncbi:MAG TPA: hypothetical protein VK249_30445 [Anaerolineales bacterium]|nr:hypothetical protein [Anaerolineales bacterium]
MDSNDAANDGDLAAMSRRGRETHAERARRPTPSEAERDLQAVSGDLR